MKRGGWLIVIAVAMACLGGAYWWSNPADSTADESAAEVATLPVAGGAASAAVAGASASAVLSGRALLEARYNRAAQSYNTYRDSTRYPPTSRLMRDHADQEKPFAPIADERQLHTGSGKVAKGIKLRTSQERFYLSGSEAVDFKLEAVDDDGNRLPLSVRRSTVFNVEESPSGSSLRQVSLPFTDDGAGGDVQAKDSVYTARFTPATQGFADYLGTIRLSAQISVQGEDGEVSFDVVYTGGTPAVWLGAREALEKGSLSFYLKAKVTTAGRYVISGRVYDANGTPFALVQFNDEVQSGITEFKLQLFGALIKDMNPVFPLRLVDVDGFLLKPDVFPDRSMLTRQPGTVVTTALYKNEQFSSDEWSSEERTRYLNELRQDLLKAEDALK